MNRISSLDAFRGITIAGMIVVNNPGSWGAVYAPLKHAEWHGWTPTDLIFPFFLFIVGVAMTFSFSKRLHAGARKAGLLKHAVVRSFILFALGMILTGIPDFNYDKKLILDVLQRIAVVYLLSAVFVLYLRERGQLTAAVASLLVYWVLMVTIEVPGYGKGVLEWKGSVWDYTDRLIFEGWHSHAEGILSLIPSVSTVLLGSLTGAWLRQNRPPRETLIILFVAGNALTAIGLTLDGLFPINKLLWSPSYVVFTAGVALSLLGMCYWAIDLKGWRRWSEPFLVFGVNPLATFFLASLVGRAMGLFPVSNVAPGDAGSAHVFLKSWIYQTAFASWLDDVNASLAFAIAYTVLWWGIMRIFHRRRIFLKV